MLTLSEKLLLLALHDEKGSVVFNASTALPYGLSGAILIELFLQKHLNFENDSVSIVSTHSNQSPILNDALDLIKEKNTSKDIKYWISQFTNKLDKVRERITHDLVEKEILKKEEDTFLWVFSVKRYPTANIHPEAQLREHLHDIVLKKIQANEEDIALLSLVKACDLIKEVFSEQTRDIAEQEIERLTKNSKVGSAVLQISEQITTAILLMIVTSSVTTSIILN